MATEDEWLTIDGNALGQEPLWRVYLPTIRTRLHKQGYYPLEYPNITRETHTKEIDLIKKVTHVDEEIVGDTRRKRLKFVLSPSQMEDLLSELWLNTEDEVLDQFLISILQTLNIEVI